MALESPCTKVCVVDPVAALCIGCGRRLDEIARWSVLTDGERRRIMGELRERLAALRVRPADRTAPG